jgi:uncharacterized protein (DUF1499 family)
MRKARAMMLPLIAVASAAAAAVIGVRIFMGQPNQDRLFPPERVDITTLHPPLPPPSFLACPPHYCVAIAGISTPIFALPSQQLRNNWAEMIARQPRVTRVAQALDGRRLFYIQHSLLFRFPDIITVEFVSLAPDQSSIAIYSRSRYGRYDFEQNRHRLENWLGRLAAMAPEKIRVK